MRGKLIIDILKVSCQKYGEKKAVVCGTSVYSYRSLWDEILKFGQWLEEHGDSQNMPTGLFMKNRPEFIIGYYGLVYADCVTMLVDHSLKREELSVIIADCHLNSILICRDDYEDFPLKDAYEISYQFMEYMLLSRYKGEFIRPFEEEKLADIVSGRFSSGTTGVPKCMIYKGENIIAASTNWKMTVGLKEDEKVMCVVNYTHGLAFNTAMLSPLSVGAEIHIFNNYSPKQIGKYIQTNRIHIFVAFPVLYGMMAERKLSDKYDFTTLRMCVSSGAVLHSEIKKKFKESVGIHISDLYGVAETGLCILNQTEDYDSIGVPLANVEIDIFGEEGNILPNNVQGQIGIKSQSRARSYYNFPEEFEKRLTSEQYYLSGDIAVIKESGMIYVKGRNSEFINVSGKKVDPKEIEELLLEHHDISDVAVYGKTNPNNSDEVLCAAIVKRDAQLTREDVTFFLHGRIASYKMPQIIHFLETLPRNSSGKVLRRVLKEI